MAVERDKNGNCVWDDYLCWFEDYEEPEKDTARYGEGLTNEVNPVVAAEYFAADRADDGTITIECEDQEEICKVKNLRTGQIFKVKVTIHAEQVVEYSGSGVLINE